MLIRSQDKKNLYNLNTNKGIWINTTRTKLTVIGEGLGELGSYSTESKAIKVLDMIQSAYESSLYCDHAFDNAAQIQRPYIFASNTVFQMPQDSEVGE